MADDPRDLHQRAAALFAGAVERHGESRRRYLDDACGDDARLRAEVEALLAHDGTAGRFLESPPLGEHVADALRSAEASAAIGGPASLPATIGRYRILGVLGEGGMGVVYRAEQDQPRRPVALKVLRPGVVSPSVLRRFAQEAQTLGRLHHHGIAQVYDAGTFESGSGVQPYFAMELVEGPSLLQYAGERRLGMRERLGLIIRICEAVDHAHRRGVIHRDLKPGNILVVDEALRSGDWTTAGGAEVSAGQPKILDFGVARVTDADVQLTTIRTDIGQLIGTLPYMSPEQVSGDPASLDTRSDVYAIGVIAYELLSGHPPLDLAGKLIHEAVRLIREEDPRPLSSIDRVFRGDLDTILGKALEKEKTRRYASVAALSEDLRRYVHDEPIAARPPSAMYQLRKFARRNRAFVLGAAAVFVVLTAGIVGTGVGLRRALRSGELARDREQQAIAARNAERDQRERVERRERDLQRIGAFQSRLLYDLDPAFIGQEIVRELRVQAASAPFTDGGTGSEVPAASDAMDALLARVNATNLGRHLIDRTMLERAAATIDREYMDDPALEAGLRQTLAGSYIGLGLFGKAEPHLRRAHDLFRGQYGDDDPRSLYVQRFISVVLEKTGRLEEAEAVARDLLDRLGPMPEEDPAAWLEAINQLALTLDHQGRLEDAAPFYRRAVEGRMRALGADHPDTLSSLHNFAGILGDLGQIEEAEATFDRVLEGRRRVLGADHRDTLTTLTQYALLLHRQRRYEDAERWYREAYEGRRRALGDAHPDTASALNALGTTLLALGRLEDAESMIRRALEQRRAVLGTDHPETLNSMHNLASALRQSARLEDLEAILLEATAVARRVLPPAHPGTRLLYRQLAMAYRDLDRPQESAAAWAEALAAAQRAGGDAHPATLDMRHEYARALVALERFDDAALRLQETWSALGEPDALMTGAARARAHQTAALLAEIAERQGRADDAAAWETRARMLAAPAPG